MASRNIVVKNNTRCFKSALQQFLDFSFLVKKYICVHPQPAKTSVSPRSSPLGHPPFLLRLPSNAFPDIGSVGRIEKKKKLKKKSQEVSEQQAPRTTLKVNIHIFGLTKCTIYCEKSSCFCSWFSLCCYYAHFSDLGPVYMEVGDPRQVM